MTLKIAVIGGGFSGTLSAIHLFKNSSEPINITLYNFGFPTGKGVAYCPPDDLYRLNVPAAKMGAIAGEPDHFSKWLIKQKGYEKYSEKDLQTFFAPRRMYGTYLKDLLNQTVAESNGQMQLSIVEQEVINIDRDSDVTEITCADGNKHIVDIVILATGNELPADPVALTNKNVSYYFRNSWDDRAFENLDKVNHFLIIGSGLSMVDVFQRLVQKGFKGKITSISPKGYLPMPHAFGDTYEDYMKELGNDAGLIDIFSLVKKNLKKSRSIGLSWQSVIEVLRPLSQEMWLRFNEAEKARFMRHLRHLWGVARHRVPQDSHDSILSKIKQGSFEILAGRVKNIEEQGKDLHIDYVERKSGKTKNIVVQRIINCTGPLTDYSKSDKTLFKNLFSRKIIETDAQRLGLNALPDGTIIHPGVGPSDYLFTLGTPLKGVLWETTAVNELRMQSKKLARKLLQSKNQCI